jgi:hypothetical protein
VQGDTDLEVALRRSLSQAASGARPARADLAGRVMTAGRRRRVTRAPVAALAVVAATMVASGVLFYAPEPAVSPYYGVALVEPTPQSTPSPTVELPAPTADPMPQLDDRVGRIVPHAGDDRVGAGLVLARNDGTGIDLRHVRGVVSAHRIGTGWALVTGGDHPRLYWVTERQAPTLVLAGLDALAVDRARVAWRRGSAMSTATISPAGQLEHRVEVGATGELRDPVGFLGDAVLLRDAAPDAHAVRWGIWRPAHDDYRPTVSARVVEVFGTLPDGRTAVGLIPVGAARCLALLDVDEGLAVGKTACLPLVPASGHPAVVSPDGRWLISAAAAAEETAATVDGGDDSGSTATVLIDLTAAFAGAGDAVTEVEGVPGPVGRALWPDEATVIYPVDGGVVQLQPAALVAGGEDAAELWPTAGDPIVMVEV